MIKWIEKEKGFHIGEVDGKTMCKISEHWTGAWLDGFGIPVKCRSLESAKKAADLEWHTRFASGFRE